MKCIIPQNQLTFFELWSFKISKNFKINLTLEKVDVQVVEKEKEDEKKMVDVQ